MRRRLIISGSLVLSVFLASNLAQLLDAQARQPAVRGVLPNGPVFAPDRPKPPAGSVLDIESLVVVPSDDFRMERRNNFYKKDGSDGLYQPNVFLEGDLVFYNHIGGHITTPEETAKHYELLVKNFKVGAAR